MAGVINNSQRQYNLKTIGKNGNRVTVRIVPGFNVVDDKHWSEFVSKEGKALDAYVSQLKEQGKLSFGKVQDDQELESEVKKSKSKSQVMPKDKK
jgi:hypothetical protein